MSTPIIEKSIAIVIKQTRDASESLKKEESLKRYSPSLSILADYIEHDQGARKELSDSFNKNLIDLHEIKLQIFLLATITGKLHIDKKIDNYRQINDNIPKQKEESESYIRDTLNDMPDEMLLKLETHADSVSKALGQFYDTYHQKQKPKLDAADKEVAEINLHATKMKIQ